MRKSPENQYLRSMLSIEKRVFKMIIQIKKQNYIDKMVKLLEEENNTRKISGICLGKYLLRTS